MADGALGQGLAICSCLREARRAQRVNERNPFDRSIPCNPTHFHVHTIMFQRALRRPIPALVVTAAGLLSLKYIQNHETLGDNLENTITKWRSLVFNYRQGNRKQLMFSSLEAGSVLVLDSIYGEFDILERDSLCRRADWLPSPVGCLHRDLHEPAYA